VHHRGALGQVRAEPDPVRVRNSDAAGQDVVDHPRELVDAEHGHRPTQPQPGSHALEPGDRARPVVGPHDVREQPEHPVEVDLVRAHQPVAEQVQAQVDVGRVDRRLGQ
jgi:hypothetical protein